MKIQVLIGVKFTCYLIYQLLTLAPFRYKILNNVLFLNKKLYTFGITNTAPCFLITLWKKLLYIFFDCIHVKSVWERLQMKFQNDFILPLLTPKTATLGLHNEANDIYNILSYILLIFKYYSYTSRENAY